MRIGHGFDVHKLEAGKPLVLCGVNIAHTHGLKAHSDGDVAIHALCDAMLGAAALGDIGRHFPDTDVKNKNRNSREFLLEVKQLTQNAGLKLNNLDLTIVAQKPKLAPYIEKMQRSLSGILSTDIANINIKATTAEGLGFTGREEGIAAHAMVLLTDSEL